MYLRVFQFVVLYLQSIFIAVVNVEYIILIYKIFFSLTYSYITISRSTY